MTLAKIITNNTITVYLPHRSTPFTISREHKLAEALLTALAMNDIAGIEIIIDKSKLIETYSSGALTVRGGEVFLGDERVDDVIAQRVIELYAAGIDFSYMEKFLQSLMRNPSYQSRKELYLFLENGDMPITEDGRFLAYKWVRDNYHDVHSGKFDNSVGKILEMPRGKVDDNRENLCSSGFHVCTHGYTAFGPRLMLVAVAPEDVVSVPKDYNNAKMRCCKYEVLKEIPVDDYVKMQGSMVRIKPEEQTNQCISGVEDDDCGYDDCDFCNGSY